MDLLTRLFGEEAARRIREAGREASTPRRAMAAPPPALLPRPVVPAASRAPRAVPPPSGVPDLAASVSDFPTSILGTARTADAPLLAAFGSRNALLAAIVFSEALAPPVALREHNPLRF